MPTRVKPTKENAHYYAVLALVLATLCQLGFDVPKLAGRLLGFEVAAHAEHGAPPVPTP